MVSYAFAREALTETLPLDAEESSGVEFFYAQNGMDVCEEYEDEERPAAAFTVYLHQDEDPGESRVLWNWHLDQVLEHGGAPDVDLVEGLRAVEALLTEELEGEDLAASEEDLLEQYQEQLRDYARAEHGVHS